jgi:hypothetical protein
MVGGTGIEPVTLPCRRFVLFSVTGCRQVSSTISATAHAAHVSDAGRALSKTRVTFMEFSWATSVGAVLR